MSVPALLRRGAPGLAVVASLAAVASPASAGVNPRVAATCDVTALPSLPPADFSRLTLLVSGKTGGPILPGASFSLENLRVRAEVNATGLAPTTGQYSAQLESATVTASGATEPSAPIKEAPLDLGTVDRSRGLPLRWDVPPTGTLSPIGPFTASASTRNIALGLTFSVRVNYVDPNTPTFAPVAARLNCTSDGPIASVPVYRPATALATVAKVVPNRAAPGSWVYVYGRRLDSVTSVGMLPFGNTSYEILSSTTIRAQVPSPLFFTSPGPYLPLRVSVTNDVGSSADTRWDDLAFLYQRDYTGPAVTSVTPSTVPTDKTSIVWLEGSFLKGATKVTIGGEEAPFLAINDSRIAVQTTPRAAGNYGIGVTAPAGVMPDEQITVRYAEPAA